MNISQKILLTIALLFSTMMHYSQNEYHQWFTSEEMRIDLSHTGDATTEYYFVEGFKAQPQWAGRLSYLVDTSGYGDNYFEVRDSISEQLIFSSGYNNLFNEWQATDEAKTSNRSFEEVIRFPYPKQTVMVKLFRRLKNGNLKELHRFFVNPYSYRVNRGLAYHFKTERLYGSKPLAQALDIAIMAEGYTLNEMDKFKADAKKMMETLFQTAPFDKVREQFNVWLVYSESLESGTDIYGDSIFKNTILNTHFYTFNSERYLTTQSIKTMHDLAALVPSDQMFILVNTAKYGGGGIYNYYNLTSTDNPSSVRVFIHEFGHGFAGLSDEYFDGSLSYASMYDLDTEPWNPNISTLKQPEKKWKDMVDKDTPIPTPETSSYQNKVGFYEGGGYVKKGVYRPWQECEMKVLYKGFCPVCQKAILQTVKWCVDE